MKKKPLIPFSWLPFSWGMKGSTRTRAKAEYELTGYELDIAISHIDFKDAALAEAMLDIEFKYSKISEEKYEAQKIEMMDDSIEKQIATVETLYKFDHISEIEAQKRYATIQGEPFFHFDVDLVDGELELEVEYNQLFVDHIKQFGYVDDVDSTAIDSYVADFGKKLYQTEDETLLDANNALDDQIIKTEREGLYTSYR